LDFAAQRHENQVLLKWKTAYEVDNLGFHLYRDLNGSRERITPSIVAGSALFAGEGTALSTGMSYAWTDRLPAREGAVTYWLESIDLEGVRKRHGPYSPEDIDLGLAEGKNTILLRALGRSRAARLGSSQQSVVGPAETGAGVTRSQAQPQMPQSIKKTDKGSPSDTQESQTQRRLASGPAVKIEVNQEGWYRVTADELIEAGFAPDVAPDRIGLYVQGKREPLVVFIDNDDRLQVIEFYGLGIDTPYSDRRAYWLAESPPDDSMTTVIQTSQIQTGKGGPDTGEPEGSFPYSVVLKERLVFFAALKNGETENFFGGIVMDEPLEQHLMVHHLDPEPPENAFINVTLQGVTDVPHEVSVSLNGQYLDTVAFAGQEQGALNMAIPHSSLADGINVVTLQAVGGETDMSVVDVVRLTYRHTYMADDDTLKCLAAGGKKVTIGGFTNGDIRVFDVTAPSDIKELPVTVEDLDSEFTVTAKAKGNGERILFALTDDRVKQPAAVRANTPSQWHKLGRRADLSIIAHGDFLESLKPLRDLREGQGWSVALIDVEDLYDEFSFGHKTPYALKDYLSTATENKIKKKRNTGPIPMYVVLAGDASFDPRNYLAMGGYDFVPTMFVATDLLEAPSDDWLADFDGDDLPELAVGRLPVRTSADTGVVVDKLLSYHKAVPTDWSDKVLLVADRNDGEHDFEAMNTRIRLLLPESMTIDEVLRGQMDNATAKARIRDAVNEGRLLVNYIGHGSTEVWRGQVLTSEDVSETANEPRFPVFVNMTCLNGHFADLYTFSLAEALLLDPDGGAIGVWASSGLTWPEGQALINQEMIRLLFAGEPLRLGEAALRAKSATEDPDVRRSWVLFGDPTLRLK
ncbi:C25 family cysteine peptidase, partial [Acidobacteriota bacterium]